MFKTEKLIYSDKSANDASENIGRVFGSNASVRYAGADRYDTAILAADALKKSMDVKRFENIIIACGSDYPDALSGSCLAAEKNAPIPVSYTHLDVYKRQGKDSDIKENMV